ncbi:MAG: GatB/YqeY domain-containing protein [Acidiferrobacterales bacterium]|nr:GatB/YqeY domain-containing protein [Gammaproteobacteria bacterium]
MSLKERISQDMKDALRARDQQRLNAIRFLLAAIQRREVDTRTTLDDPDIISVVEKLIKQSRDAAQQFIDGARQDLADKENREIAVWEAYMPIPLTDDELDALIADALAQTGVASMKGMGKVMGVLKPQLQGRADMGQVSAKVKAKLSNS